MVTSNDPPLVSVIMPTYNRASLIPRAIESLLGQGYDNWELVVVDDGSTDETQDVLAPYADRDSRIRVSRHTRNAGLAAALNTCLDSVCGEFSIRLDDDDELYPHTLERFVTKFQEIGPAYGMVVAHAVDPHSGEISGTAFANERELTYEDAICQRLKGEFIGMWRSSCVQGLRFDGRAYAGEDLVWHHVYRRAPAWFIPDVLRKYHQGDSTSHAVTDLKFDDREKYAASAVFERLYIQDFGADMRRSCRKTLAHHYQVLALYEAIARQRRNCARSVTTSLYHDPSLMHVALLVLPILPRPVLRRLTVWWAQRGQKSLDGGVQVEAPDQEPAQR